MSEVTGDYPVSPKQENSVDIVMFKCVQEDVEVVEGKAPAATAIVR